MYQLSIECTLDLKCMNCWGGSSEIQLVSVVWLVQVSSRVYEPSRWWKPEMAYNYDLSTWCLLDLACMRCLAGAAYIQHTSAVLLRQIRSGVYEVSNRWQLDLACISCLAAQDRWACVSCPTGYQSSMHHQSEEWSRLGSACVSYPAGAS